MADRRITKTRQEIQDAFLALLKDYPIEKISVKKICEVANVNRSTFYNHYEDYPTFLKSLEDTLVEKYMSSFSLYHYDKNTDDYLDDQLEAILKNKELFKLLFHDEFINVRKRCIDEEKKLAMPKWLKYSDVTEEQAEVIFAYMINGFFGTLEMWIHSGFAMEKSQIKTLMTNVCQRGVYHYIYTKK